MNTRGMENTMIRTVAELRILVLDNYDSFTYNLVHILRELGVKQLDVVRNDKINLHDVGAYDKILLSPGPGIPEEAGLMPELIKMFGATKSILGICLGHQAIAETYGSTLYNMSEVLHGVPTPINLTENSGLFEGLPKQIEVGRYHSWCVHSDSINGQLEVTALDANGQIMGIRHATYDVQGLQFHPESVLTQHGKKIMENWLKN